MSPLSIEIAEEQASIGTLVDLTFAKAVSPISVNISTQYIFQTNQTTKIESRSYSDVEADGEAFTYLPILDLLDDSVGILRIDVSIHYTSYYGDRTYNYHLQPALGSSVNITREGSSWFYNGYNGLVFF